MIPMGLIDERNEIMVSKTIDYLRDNPDSVPLVRVGKAHRDGMIEDSKAYGEVSTKKIRELEKIAEQKRKETEKEHPGFKVHQVILADPIHQKSENLKAYKKGSWKEIKREINSEGSLFPLFMTAYGSMMLGLGIKKQKKSLPHRNYQIH
jgi:hypothetical protein